MPTMEEYTKQPREQRLKRLERTADELACAIRGQSDAALARRPDAKNWAPKEVVCHLRDTEELFKARFDTILAQDNPPIAPPDPARRAAERRAAPPPRAARNRGHRIVGRLELRSDRVLGARRDPAVRPEDEAIVGDIPRPVLGLARPHGQDGVASNTPAIVPHLTAEPVDEVDLPGLDRLVEHDVIDGRGFRRPR